MMQRRRLVFITAAGLITALASLYMAGLSLWRVWGIRLTADAVCVLMENLGLTLCALLMLAFSLASCWKDRRPGAFCLVCVAAYVLLSTGTVSYTHLDVYKRQLYRQAGRRRRARGRIFARVAGRGPVSYTHLPSV